MRGGPVLDLCHRRILLVAVLRLQPLLHVVRGVPPHGALELFEIADRHAVEEQLVQLLEGAAFHLGHEEPEEDETGEV